MIIKLIITYFWVTSGIITAETLDRDFPSFRHCEMHGFMVTSAPTFDEQLGTGHAVSFTCLRVTET